jgi:branched-chain amino acid transport system substrate-binding protein
VPGLGQTGHNGAKAYVNFVNSQGGVCGRKVKLLAVDDRFDTGTNRSEHQRLMGEALGFAGAWSVVDDGGASVLQGTNVPDATLALSDQRIALPNNFSPNPIDLTADTNATDRMFAYFKQAYGASKGAIVWGAQASSRKRAQSFEADMRRAGIEVVVKVETAITQTDYTGVATQMKNAGADVVITALELGAMAKLAQALKQQNHALKVPFYGAQAYGRKFVQLAGAASEGTTLGLAYTPVEDAGSNPGMAQFKQWYERTSPGAEMDFFAITSWASTKLLLDAVAEAGPNPTRDQVMAKLRTKTDFDAGGVLAPRTNPAQKKASPCFLVVAVEGGRWVRKHPATGYDCG